MCHNGRAETYTDILSTSTSGILILSVVMVGEQAGNCQLGWHACSQQHTKNIATKIVGAAIFSGIHQTDYHVLFNLSYSLKMFISKCILRG